MDAYDVLEWVRALARWVHVFAAILWIGQTYLFHFFEHNLEKPAGSGDHVIGNLWMVHGGGYYVVEKQKYPLVMPKTLHWFKWEAGITWISGAVLIGLTYYYGGLLTEPDQNFTLAAAVGIGTILAGWGIYDLLIRSPLARKPLLFAAFGWVALMALTWGLGRFMSPRSAFLHVGAMIGTIMAGNVWMRIIPSMQKIIALASAGKPIDTTLASTGPIRSKHNSFMVVPLIFMMISNHYPTISFGHTYSWLMMGIILILGWSTAKFVLGR